MMQTYRPILTAVRLAAGLILLFYTATHFLNHAAGILGLETLERARLVFLGFWRSPLMFSVVPLSLAIHAGLSLLKLLNKRTFRGLRRSEWLQLSIGLFIPLVLVPHIYDTRFAANFYGVNDSYTYFIATTYTALPSFMAEAVFVWLHGNLGLHGYLRQKPWYPRVKTPLEAVGLLLPALALAGIVAARREIEQLPHESAWLATALQTNNPQWAAFQRQAAIFKQQFSTGYLSLIVGAFVVRAVVRTQRSLQNVVRVDYVGRNPVWIPRGMTLLEGSLHNRIPHAHVCGGRGRCSTCRVRVLAGQKKLSIPSEAELAVLRRVGAPPNVRLACQAIPYSACTIQPLLPPSATAADGFQRQRVQQGVDQQIAILFADLRNFTSLTEERLPYDTVFMLNQYFQAMGQAIEAHGGYLDKFLGDGVMALFGLESEIGPACRQALTAVQAMSRQLDLLNEQLAADLPAPLQIGMGLHCGHVIVGEMGYKHAKGLTAVGSAVNIASRLENATKEHACQLIVSDELLALAQVDFSAFPKLELHLRGRSQPLAVTLVANAQTYPLPPSTP